MKLRSVITLILLCAFAASIAHAQGNCCEIVVSGVTRNYTTTKVSASGSKPGGLYISTETDTYNIACDNFQSGKAVACSSATNPTNMVTATGSSGYTPSGAFMACNPVFHPVPSQSNSSSDQVASFTDTGTSFTGVNASGGCIASPNQTMATSTCIFQACQSEGGGGGCECPGGCPPCTDIVVNLDGTIKPNAAGGGSCCVSNTPIIIDTSGNGFALTNAANGVWFDMSGTDHPIQTAWTASGANNAFLALPGPDGLVHNGKQLFGNYTPQPPSASPNGFAALAVYDDPKNGGNGNGEIDPGDAIYSKLRLWIDTNHDGIAQPEEMHTLDSLGVTSISLHYYPDKKTDEYGNIFRYRAAVDTNQKDPDHVGRTAYDVIFVSIQPQAKAGSLQSCPANPYYLPAAPVAVSNKK